MTNPATESSRDDTKGFNEAEVRRRLKAMQDDQLVAFIRDTITRLDALADRLEAFAEGDVEGNSGA